MFVLPPSPTKDFLQIALPDLKELTSDSGAWKCSREARIRLLEHEPESLCNEDLLEAAGFLRDLGRPEESCRYCEALLKRAFHENSFDLIAGSLAIQAVALMNRRDFGAAGHAISQMKLFTDGDAGALAKGLYEETAATFYRRIGRLDGPDPAEFYFRAIDFYSQCNCQVGIMRA